MFAQPALARVVREVLLPGSIPAWAHPEWLESFPWLLQATTGRGDDFDFRLFGETPSGTVVDRWLALRRQTGFQRAVHARQVHAADLLVHDDDAPGLLVSERFDGHVTATRGVLLTVSVADCVPVFAVDAKTRSIALLHAGWRGSAAGILEGGVRRMKAEFGSDPADIHVHLGPAICGNCYEVGPEVFAGLGLPAPAGPRPIDLRAVLALRAEAAGIDGDHLTRSAWCTRCDEVFFSHRGADPERQLGLLGLRA